MKETTIKKRRTSKLLFSSYIEGAAINVQIVTFNDWKTFHFNTGTNIRKGYKGTYKGDQRYYKDPLPEGMVRHHTEYDDTNINKGIVYMTRGEHIQLHKPWLGRK